MSIRVFFVLNFVFRLFGFVSDLEFRISDFSLSSVFSGNGSIKNNKLCETKPIFGMPKMNLNRYMTDDYNNKSPLLAMPKQSQTKPISPPLQSLNFTHLAKKASLCPKNNARLMPAFCFPDRICPSASSQYLVSHLSRLILRKRLSIQAVPHPAQSGRNGERC